MQKFTLPQNKYKKLNLLVLGASGGVARAFFHQFLPFRDLFDSLIMIDRVDRISTDEYLDHKALRYHFEKKELSIPADEEYLINLIKKNNIDLVIDLTDAKTIPIIETISKTHASYINTAIMDDDVILSELLNNFIQNKEKYKNGKYIIESGMNPGIVNLWVAYGIKKYGVPREIIHFEYDTSVPKSGWQPMITWSPFTFLLESAQDPGGIILGRDKIKHLYPNALMHQKNMKDILSPIMNLTTYPDGFLVLHDECYTIGYKYDVPSQFIYAINIQTMEYLVSAYKKGLKLTARDLLHGDNTTVPLDGADTIGVLMKYDDKNVYYLNSAHNKDAVGINATSWQVAVGVTAAVVTILTDDTLQNGAYFIEDLESDIYKEYVFNTMETFEYIQQGEEIQKTLVG
jgi:saccharopine dehydrogenase-like NADP-dependent oxidoreductase